MKSIFKKRYPPDGMSYAEAKAQGRLRIGDVLWIKFRDAAGILRRESSGSTKQTDAARLLKKREGAAVEGKIVPVRNDRITVAAICDLVRQDYQRNQLRSAARFGYSLRRFWPRWGRCPPSK